MHRLHIWISKACLIYIGIYIGCLYIQFVSLINSKISILHSDYLIYRQVRNWLSPFFVSCPRASMEIISKSHWRSSTGLHMPSGPLFCVSWNLKFTWGDALNKNRRIKCLTKSLLHKLDWLMLTLRLIQSKLHHWPSFSSSHCSVLNCCCSSVLLAPRLGQENKQPHAKLSSSTQDFPVM